MKKIKYVRALKDNCFDESFGFYYKDRNNIEYAIDCDTHRVTELTTGYSAVDEYGLIKQQIEKIEQRSDAVLAILQTDVARAATVNMINFKLS